MSDRGEMWLIRTLPSGSRPVCLALSLAAVLSSSLWSVPRAQDTGAPAEAASERVGVRCVLAFRFPFGDEGGRFSPYATAGGTLELPTRVRGLKLRTTVEVGTLGLRDGSLHLRVLHGRLVGAYALGRSGGRLTVSPFGGLCNMSVKIVQSRGAGFAFIGTNENEFGVIGGLSLRMRWGRFVAELPLSMDYTFLSPRPFLNACTLLGVGLVF